MLTINAFQCQLPIPRFTFCSKLIDSVRLMARAVRLSPLEAIQRRTWRLGPYWAVQRSWFARVNALCNLSRKKSREVAESLPSRFLSRRCFTLCVTMDVEPRIAKQYKFHHCCSCKNYRGKGMESGGKSVCVVFWLTRRSRVREEEKMRFGASLLHEQQIIAYSQTHDYGPPKTPLKLAM